jgi:hypothetical protein
MIANHPPLAPALSGAPVGPTTQRSATITAQFPVSPVPIAKVVWSLCGTTCGQPNTVPVAPGATASSFTVTVPNDGSYTVRAYTVDAAGHASASTSEAYHLVSAGGSVTLPARPDATVRLPETVGRGGVRLLLSVRRLPHRRLGVAVRTRPKRPGHLVLRLAFAGHRSETHRLHLRSGVASVVARIPRGASDLVVSLTGFGARSRHHVHLAAPSRH